MAEKSKTKKTVDFAKIDIPTFVELYKEIEEANKLGEFKINDYVEVKPAHTTLITVYEAEGKAKVYIGKDGKQKIKKEKVAKGSEKKKVFNLMKAKRAFYEAFKDEYEWTNLPKASTKKEEEAKKKAENKNALKSIGVEL